MDRNDRWEAEPESCPALRGAVGPQTSPVRLNDGPTDAKPHTGAVGFGCKEWIENLLRKMRRKPHAGIADRNKNLLVFSFPRPDYNLP